MTPKATRIGPGHLDAPDSHIGTFADMLLEHEFVVHLVDVIARQDHDELRVIALDDVDVLVDRVGRSLVPQGLGHTLAGGQDVETLVALGSQEVPAALQVTDEAMSFVLGCHGNMPDAGVEGIRKRKVDNA
jgi:hypothetical protein